MRKRSQTASVQHGVRATTDMLELPFSLVEADLMTATPLFMKRLTREVGFFILHAPEGMPGGDTSGLWVGGGKLSEAPSHTDIVALQRSVRALLDAVARRGPPREDELWRPVIRPVVHADGSVQLAVDEGSIHDRYMLALVARLQRVGANAVQACKECGRAFFRKTRGLYCGPACRRRVVLASWHRNKSKYRPPKKGRKRGTSKSRGAQSINKKGAER